MKTIKKFICTILALTFMLSVGTLAACNNDEAITPPGQAETPLPDAPLSPPSEEPAPPIVETPTTPPQEEPQPTPSTPQVTYAKYIRCNTSGVNIRSGAGTSFAVLGTAAKDTTYAVIGQSGNWYKTYYRGKVAYISASYAAVLTMEKSNDEQVENVINEGYKRIGVPYVYGAIRVHDGKGNLLSGFTAEKFDCSSLVQYMFYKGADKLLQVTTRTQVTQGKHVPKSEIKRGDCLYFTNESRQHLSGIERVGHVAVYLGDNYILHTASDYARIEKISAARWNYFLEARRFL